MSLISFPSLVAKPIGSHPAISPALTHNTGPSYTPLPQLQPVLIHLLKYHFTHKYLSPFIDHLRVKNNRSKNKVGETIAREKSPCQDSLSSFRLSASSTFFSIFSFIFCSFAQSVKMPAHILITVAATPILLIILWFLMMSLSFHNMTCNFCETQSSSVANLGSNTKLTTQTSRPSSNVVLWVIKVNPAKSI